MQGRKKWTSDWYLFTDRPRRPRLYQDEQCSAPDRRIELGQTESTWKITAPCPPL